MKQAKFESDYAPESVLTLTQSVDGDIIISIHGEGECRIATDGGKLRGNTLVEVTKRFSEIIDFLNDKKAKRENVYYWHLTSNKDIPKTKGKEYLCEVNGINGPQLRICTYGYSQDLNDTCFYYESFGSHKCDVTKWTELPE